MFGNSKSIARCPPAKALGIHEEDAFSIMVFVLNQGERIPLHDHPGMTGVIKCLSGRISVSSFSPLPIEDSYVLPNCISKQVPKERQSYLIPCVENTRVTVSSSTDMDSICTLSPMEGNIHEIEAVEGSPAFLDILSPPYDGVERDCRYFTIVGKEVDKALKKEITWILEVSPPSSFWTSSLPYRGPRIE
jgi:cysteamine dioxygenase